jgi:hypothetical protein
MSSEFRTQISCLLLVLATGALATSCNGPLPFLSGGALSGQVQPAPETWALAEDFGVVQIETRPSEPYSVNVAYTQIDGHLYLNAGDTETEWVTHIAGDPSVRMRVGETIYESRAERVTESGEVAAFGTAWTDHSMFHRDPTELERVWIYRLVKP